MRDPGHDAGYTLLEVMVTISLLGILMAVAVSGWSSWAVASAHSGTARELQSLMRQAQQRAVTEGRATCVLFDDAADSYSVFRGQCSDPAKVLVQGPFTPDAAQVHVDSPSFTSAAGTPSVGVSFHGRGTASPGTVRITRDGSTKVYLVTVDGLTGRVSLS